MVAENKPSEEPKPPIISQKDILAEAVRQTLQMTVMEPMMEVITNYMTEVRSEWDKVKNVIEPLLRGKFSQCQHCGSFALNDMACEDLKFICPTCALMSQWKFHDKTGKYTLEKIEQ